MTPEEMEKALVFLYKKIVSLGAIPGKAKKPLQSYDTWLKDLLKESQKD
jgi:hypothetical protein